VPKPRAAKLETPTARRKLPIRRKPFFVTVSPNVRLAYRRNLGPGTWSVRVTGPGIDWLKRIGLADDLEPADGKAVLTYWGAIDVARKLARRETGDAATDDDRPVSVAEALDGYRRDLEARGADGYNAKRAVHHLPASMLSKPVALLGSTELCKWRDGLIEKGLSRASINRTRNALRAALTLAARRDRRIANRHVWEEDLAALPNATEARNVVFADDVVGRLIAAAYERDHKLGLLAQVLAETGGRPSQAVRLTVADLDAKHSRLMMPRSGKGHPHKRAHKMQERVPVPITPLLSALLKQETKSRAGNAPLLLQANGEPWGYRRNDRYRKDFGAVVAAVGLDPKTTIYSLRHSAISRLLLRGVPVTLVADLCDTSEREIRKHYAKLISHHGDEIARRALLDVSQSPAATVVALPPGRRA